MIISKIVLTAGDPDVSEWNFENSPIEHEEESDLQYALHLIVVFMEDLTRVIIKKSPSSFAEVLQLYPTLFPPPVETLEVRKEPEIMTLPQIITMMEDLEDPIKEATMLQNLVCKVQT